MVRVLVFLGVFLLGVSSAHAQTAPAASTAPRRGWLDVNYLSLHSMQDAQGYGFADTIFLETRSFGAGYPKLP